MDQDDAIGNDKEGDEDLLKLEFCCNNNQRDGACDDSKESDGFHRCVEFLLRIVRWERVSVPCGRGRRVRRGWGVFCRTLRDIYGKCRGIDVDFIRMDNPMFALIFGLRIRRWGPWVD